MFQECSIGVPRVFQGDILVRSQQDIKKMNQKNEDDPRNEDDPKVIMTSKNGDRSQPINVFKPFNAI